jgi:hypothetical protein
VINSRSAKSVDSSAPDCGDIWLAVGYYRSFKKKDILEMRILLMLFLSIIAARLHADIGVAFDRGDDECAFSVTLEALNKLPQEEWQSYVDSKCNEHYTEIEIHVFGEIKPADAADFREALPRILEIHEPKRLSVPKFYLYSPGGDVFAAIEIGQLIRKHLPEKNGTWIPPEASCVSACVLIYASGAERMMGVASRLGVHRPYFTDERFVQLGYESRQKAYQDAYELLFSAFKQYNVSTDLVDLMWSTPSTDVHYLSAEEIKRYRLIGIDLVQQETDAALLRKHCGTSANELENAYEEDNLQLHNYYRKYCADRFPLPKDCDYLCRYGKNGCTQGCTAAKDKQSACRNSDNYSKDVLTLFERHKRYRDCHADYLEEKFH